MSAPIHVSVLRDEAVDGLAPKDGGDYIDVTCGLGGHAEAILQRCGPGGRVLAFDRDPRAIELARARLAPFGDRVRMVNAPFSSVREVATEPVDGLIADLGLSSLQLDDAARGFAIVNEGPLDMRMGSSTKTAADVIAESDEPALTTILRDYGEVKHPRAVAKAILRARDEGRLATTRDLARVVEPVVRKKARIHPATLVFQALRIAVNGELDELAALLAALPSLLKPGGRVAIISFHSLEDRMVKRAFADPTPDPRLRKLPVDPVRGPLKAITKRPITPSAEEVDSNPRARSAKLRIAERRPS